MRSLRNCLYEIFFTPSYMGMRRRRESTRRWLLKLYGGRDTKWRR
jgi:hypothetical protein